MRCKKHSPDLSSTVGVCASCLRERLQVLVEAQAQAQAQPQAHSARFVPRAVSDDNHRLRKPETKPPPLNFPRSVSPYVSRRKSDCDRRRERLFYSTPQVGSAVSSAACDGRTASSSKRKVGKFWILSNLFPSRSNKTEISSRESCEPSSTASNPSWFSTILSARRQNHDANCAIDRRRCRESDRETPVTITENFSDEVDGHSRSSSGCSSESPRQRHQTPDVAAPSARRSRLGFAGKSVTSMALCLSPLVRASPNRHWSQKGVVQELGVGGAHHISTAASFCANRSRKLADFGRVNHNR
ncbi:uncharacterized protein LOC133313216 [Gastrolobium bilobum]|uniref:uncharacterized protein LOC133313216 n=1 Tax=Gastrolobium bilobum TaxID=150636 RepID=UPI002AB0A87A|nr:uncharacterized protein LOC133313216 [Gastrolobium bilobum]